MKREIPYQRWFLFCKTMVKVDLGRKLFASVKHSLFDADPDHPALGV